VVCREIAQLNWKLRNKEAHFAEQKAIKGMSIDIFVALDWKRGGEVEFCEC
jgi:hypothetical protein